MSKKRNSRPADTGTTAKKCEHTNTSHNNYSTKKLRMQALISIIAFAVLLIITIFCYSDVSAEEFVLVEHKVTYGDTLWDIAKEYKPDSMTMDRYMAWVYEHNDGGTIYPGDVVIMAEVVK